jgi:hypothetical protein
MDLCETAFRPHMAIEASDCILHWVWITVFPSGTALRLLRIRPLFLRFGGWVVG